jgi:hypothetical protein
MSFDALLPNIVSVYLGGGCLTRIYVDSGRYRGLLSLCMVVSDSRLGCCMSLKVMSSLTGNRARFTLRRRILYPRNRPLIRLCPV